MAIEVQHNVLVNNFEDCMGVGTLLAPVKW